MGIVIAALIISFIVGLIGKGRNVGFWGAFFLSIILSPIVGLIITLLSKKCDEIKIN